MLKTAVVAPMPRASVRAATAVNAGPPGERAEGEAEVHQTLRSLVTRPTSTHSTTKMLPA